MTLLGKVLSWFEEAYAGAREKALALALDLLTPRGPIPRVAVARLLRRALRNGAWKTLSREQRALLVAAARAPARLYRGEAIVEALRGIWLRVELATTRGKAVLAALVHLAATGPGRLARLLRHGLEALLVQGLQLLNNPLLRTT